MTELIQRPHQVDSFYAASKGEKVDWDAVFPPEWGSAVNFPAMFLYRELMEAYPEAKVILTVRDPNKWYDSVRETISRRRILSLAISSYRKLTIWCGKGYSTADLPIASRSFRCSTNA